MITKIKDDKSCYEVGQNNVAFISEWRVNKDIVDIFRIADRNNKLLAFKGYINKNYQIERDDTNSYKHQLSIFDI